MKANLVIWVLVLLAMVAEAMAANPHTPQQSVIGSNSLQIEIPKNLYVPRFNSFDFHFHVWNSTGYNVSGVNTNCTIHIYNSTGQHIIASQSFPEIDDSPYDYEVILGSNITDYKGIYPFIIYCTWTGGQAGFLSDYFEVAISSPEESNVSGYPIAILILAPLLFGMLLIGGAFIFGEDHAILKIFLFLFAYCMIFVSFYIGIQVVVRYYGFTALQDAISTSVYVIGSIFFVILSYFLIYAFIQATHMAAQKKQKELEY